MEGGRVCENTVDIRNWLGRGGPVLRNLLMCSTESVLMHMTTYCMYVRTYVCMYVCKYIRMHVHMYVCMYVRTYVCMYVRTYVRMYVCMYLCTYVRMYVCMQGVLTKVLF